MNYYRIIVFLLAISLLSACANVIPPTGGKPDATAPKLLSIKPKDSLLNSRITRIEMKFDEFVTVSDASKELHLSPMLLQTPLMSVSGKTVSIKIADSLLEENTTYTIDFGKAIKDLHEGNPYTGKPFTFSTGAWFDSLKIKGNLINSETGKADSTGGVKILLYDAKLPYDIVSKQKPSYVATSKSDGSFVVNGLPGRRFRIFALSETGDDLTFNDDNELIGFADTTFNPAIDTLPVTLAIFKEIPDTSLAKRDTAVADKSRGKLRFDKPASTAIAGPALDPKTFNYRVILDTGNREKRTQEITTPIDIYFSRKIEKINAERIFLSADSNGIELEYPFQTSSDTAKTKLTITTKWLPNTLYTLRLLKNFAVDSGLVEAMPSKYIFRTKSDEDYGKMEINIPEKYVRAPYLLQVRRDNDSVYLNPIKESKISLRQLVPGNYAIRIIEDTDNDGEWTTGELKKRRHAELVIPYITVVEMKAGWEHVIDFEPKKKTPATPAQR